MQFDILSQANPFQIFLDNEIKDILVISQNELVCIAVIHVPGVMLFDSNLPVFCLYNLEEGLIHDYARALAACEYMRKQFANVARLRDGAFRKFGYIVNSYIVALDYIIVKKNFFDGCIIGEHKMEFQDDDTRIYGNMIKNAYADFMISRNVMNKERTDPNFRFVRTDFFLENEKTKLQQFEYYIEKYKFSRFMNYKVEGCFQDNRFVRMYL